ERINSLAEAQKRTEERINSLVEAQKLTEERINSLAEAQKRTENEISLLVEAQKRTEDHITKLSESLNALRIDVSRLSETIGFSLEDLAKEYLPIILKEKGVLINKLERRYFILDGEEIEVNLYGEGVLNGKEILILGEVKSRIYGRDVESFNVQAEKIERYAGKESFKLMFGFAVHPSAIKESDRLKVTLFTAYGASSILRKGTW
ncbi:MAG: hypothetical protein QW372_05640, partial [Nitrososphaerales archaeon]